MLHAPALLVTNPHGAGGAAAANSSRGPWAAPPSTAQDFGCLSDQHTLLNPGGGWLAVQGKVAQILGAALLGGVRQPGQKKHPTGATMSPATLGLQQPSSPSLRCPPAAPDGFTKMQKTTGV